jgi:DNA-binding TFAR19-related protein (PDSD5 family)
VAIPSERDYDVTDVGKSSGVSTVNNPARPALKGEGLMKKYSLREFETRLKILASKGEIPYPLSDKEMEELLEKCNEVELSLEEKRKYLMAIKKAYQH